MRKNSTKEKIKQGGVAYGVFMTGYGPTTVEMLGHIGFDFVILDAEHSPIDIESCENMVRAAESANITPLIRVAINIRQNILRYLDTGAMGVQIPMVENKEDAQAVVESVKYPPEGQRGLAGVRAADYGIPRPLGEYVKDANRETMTIVQIETVKAAGNIKEILTVPGIDVFFIGPNDLSSAMGYPGQQNHPEVQKLISYLVNEIRAAGKAAGTTAYDFDLLKKNKERGFQYICYGLGPMLMRAGKEYLQASRE